MLSGIESFIFFVSDLKYKINTIGQTSNKVGLLDSDKIQNQLNKNADFPILQDISVFPSEVVNYHMNDVLAPAPKKAERCHFSDNINLGLLSNLLGKCLKRCVESFCDQFNVVLFIKIDMTLKLVWPSLISYLLLTLRRVQSQSLNSYS